MNCPYCEYDPRGWFLWTRCLRLHRHLMKRHLGDEVTDKQHANNIIVCQRLRIRNGYPAVVDENVSKN